jgi:type IV pilus assembly protein PilV
MVPSTIPAKQDGIVLLEGLIAILIFSFGVLAFAWLQAAATRQVTEAKYRLEATFAANQVLGQMWTQRANLDSFEEEEKALPALPNGKRTIQVNGRRVTITITWSSPGENKRHSYQAEAQINA